jgi:hypothetical protein
MHRLCVLDFDMVCGNELVELMKALEHVWCIRTWYRIYHQAVG